MADGVKRVLDAIRERQPNARILLSAIFPRQSSPKHRLRLRNNRINAMLKEFAEGEKVVWLDFNAKFLSPDGTLRAELFPDGLHPVERGYRIWWDAIRQFVE